MDITHNVSLSGDPGPSSPRIPDNVVLSPNLNHTELDPESSLNASVRSVPLAQLRYETIGRASALQFHIGAAGGGPSLTAADQLLSTPPPRANNYDHDHQRGQRGQRAYYSDVDGDSFMPDAMHTSSSSSDSESETGSGLFFAAASERPPTPAPATEDQRSDPELPDLLDVSDSSDDRLSGDGGDDDNDAWTDDEEEAARPAATYSPRTVRHGAPFLLSRFGAPPQFTFPPFAPSSPDATPLDVWQALVGTLPSERPPDPERAKELMSGLEPVPDDLLDRWYTAAGENADVICAVCRDDLADPVASASYTSETPRLLALSCRHVFHGECLAPWLSRRTTCPTCRYDIDPDSLTLRSPSQQPSIDTNAIAQFLAPLARNDPQFSTVDYAERLRQLFVPVGAHDIVAPPDSPLDTTAWQDALNQFVYLGGSVEERLRTYGEAIDMETRQELDEERSVYVQVEHLVRRGLQEVQRMVSEGETFDPADYLDDDAASDSESWDDSDGDDERSDDEEENEMPPLQHIPGSYPEDDSNELDAGSPPPLEGASSIEPPVVPQITSEPPPPTTPPPRRTGFWRTWRRDARVMFQALYDIQSPDTEDARTTLGDLDERARIIFRATTLPRSDSADASTRDGIHALTMSLRGDVLLPRQLELARRTDTQLFMGRIQVIQNADVAATQIVEQQYETRRERLQLLAPRTQPPSSPGPGNEADDVAAFMASLDAALPPGEHTAVLDAARLSYRERRREHRTLSVPVPVPNWDTPLAGLADLPPGAADNMLRSLVGPFTGTASTTPSSPPIGLIIPSPMMPSLMVPFPGMSTAPVSPAAPPLQVTSATRPERRKWTRPESQTLRAWVEEREGGTATPVPAADA